MDKGIWSKKNNDEHDSLAQETFCCSISTTDV